MEPHNSFFRSRKASCENGPHFRAGPSRSAHATDRRLCQQSEHMPRRPGKNNDPFALTPLHPHAHAHRPPAHTSDSGRVCAPLGIIHVRSGIAASLHAQARTLLCMDAHVRQQVRGQAREPSPSQLAREPACFASQRAADRATQHRHSPALALVRLCTYTPTSPLTHPPAHSHTQSPAHLLPHLPAHSP